MPSIYAGLPNFPFLLPVTHTYILCNAMHNSSHPISSHLISFRLVSSGLISSRLIITNLYHQSQHHITPPPFSSLPLDILLPQEGGEKRKIGNAFFLASTSRLSLICFFFLASAACGGRLAHALRRNMGGDIIGDSGPASFGRSPY